LEKEAAGQKYQNIPQLLSGANHLYLVGVFNGQADQTAA
jgi:hypothetical protein